MLQRQRLVVADRQRPGQRRVRPLSLVEEIALLEPPRLQLAIAPPRGAFRKHGAKRLPVLRRRQRVGENPFVDQPAAEVRVAKKRHVLLPSVHDIRKIRRRRADVDDHRAFLHQLRADAQAARVPRVKKRGARFGHDADVRETRRFQQRGVLLPPAVAPACRAADHRSAHLGHQRGLRADKLVHHALRKRAHVRRGGRVGQVAGFKAHLRLRRAVRHAGRFADDDAPVLHAHGGNQAVFAAKRHHARLDSGILVQQRHGALAVAQIKAQNFHAHASFAAIGATAATPRRTSSPSRTSAGRTVRSPLRAGSTSNSAACSAS